MPQKAGGTAGRRRAPHCALTENRAPTDIVCLIVPVGLCTLPRSMSSPWVKERLPPTDLRPRAALPAPYPEEGTQPSPCSPSYSAMNPGGSEFVLAMSSRFFEFALVAI